MSTLSEISKAIQEIRKLLQESLTPEFFRSVKSACDAIVRLLNDPTLTQEIKDLLARLNQLLQKVEEEGFIQKITEFMTVFQEKLSELDIESCNKVLEALGELLEQIKNTQFIEHMVDVLKSAKSVGDFFEVAKKFMGDPATVLMAYGPYAAIVGIALNKILSRKAKNSGDSLLIKQMQEMTDYLRTLTVTNIGNLRQQMFNTYKTITIDLKNHVYDDDPFFRQQMIEERDYAHKFINTVPRMRQESILALASIEKKLEKLIEKLVIEDINNQSLEQFLDYIGSGYQQYWEQLLDYTVYSQQGSLFGSQVRPKISCYEFNYESICRLYGTESVNSLMQKLSQAFFINGGGALYYELVNGLYDSAGLFLGISQLISRNEEPIDIVDPKLLELASQLQSFYHQAAPEFIKEEWKKITWPVGYDHQEHHLNERMIAIIQARAFAEYVRVNAAYFFGLYPIPRELFNGILDIPKGIYQLVRHPVQTFYGLGNLLTFEGWHNLGRAFYYHPVRMLTPSLVGGATSYAVKVSSTSSGISYLKNVSDVTKFKAGFDTFSYSANSTTSLSTATAFVPSSLAAPAVLPTEDVEKVEVISQKTTTYELEKCPPVDWDRLWAYIISHKADQETEVDAYQMIITWHHETNATQTLRHKSERFFQPALEVEQIACSLVHK